MPEVKRFCPGLPVLLVGCKIDLRDQSQVLQELEKQDLHPVTYQQVSSSSLRQKNKQPLLTLSLGFDCC